MIQSCKANPCFEGPVGFEHGQGFSELSQALALATEMWCRQGAGLCKVLRRRQLHIDLEYVPLPLVVGMRSVRCGRGSEVLNSIAHGCMRRREDLDDTGRVRCIYRASQVVMKRTMYVQLQAESWSVWVNIKIRQPRDKVGKHTSDTERCRRRTEVQKAKDTYRIERERGPEVVGRA